MLDPQTKFDRYNRWKGIWYIPTHEELYIIDRSGNLIAKYCHVERVGNWSMWIFHCVATVVEPEKKTVVESIVSAWETKVMDLVNTNFRLQMQQRRSAIL